MALSYSLCFFTPLMNDILSQLPDDIRSHIECIMDDCIVYTHNIEIYMKVIKAFLSKLKEHGMLLTINKIHTFRSEVKYMSLKMSSVDGRPPIQPLGSRVNTISTLSIPINC